jgi:1-acyl-sn-glycerol-3-phosphate acyltransferase
VRRPITITGVLVGAAVLLVTLPLWMLVSALVDLVRGRRRLPTVRLLGFALCWTWLETVGVLAAFGLWLVGQGKRRSSHYALQRWWAARLIGSLRLTCGLRVQVEGVASIPDGPIVAFGRHASLADALVSAWIFGSLADRDPRYVMKKELSYDPCLDVVGRRVPNYFVDRSSAATQREIDGIVAMAQDMDERDVAVIFPEGTRANDAKRVRALEKIGERSPERAERLSVLSHMLPPKAAGAAALLDAVPDADVVLMWHVGFEGLDTFKGIFRRLTHAEPDAVVVIEPVKRSAIPDGGAFAEWLDTQWLRLDLRIGERLLAR